MTTISWDDQVLPAGAARPSELLAGLGAYLGPQDPCLSDWYAVEASQTGAILPASLAATTLESLARRLVNLSSAECCSSTDDAERHTTMLIDGLTLLDGVLARAINPGPLALNVLPRLDDVFDLLAHRAISRLLCCQSTLRLPVILIARCGDISAEILLELCMDDVSLAVMTSAEVLRCDRLKELLTLSKQVLQALHAFTLPKFAFRGLERCDDLTSPEIEHRLACHAQLLAMAFVQFDVVQAVMFAAQTATHRNVLICSLMACLSNLVSTISRRAQAERLSRHLAAAVDFSHFTYRFVAPLIRSLMADPGQAACRTVRVLFRGFAWLMWHCAELRQPVRPVVTEWALRSIKDLSVETSSVCMVLVANAFSEGWGDAKLPPALRQVCAALSVADRGAIAEAVRAERSRTPLAPGAAAALDDAQLLTCHAGLTDLEHLPSPQGTCATDDEPCFDELAESCAQTGDNQQEQADCADSVPESWPLLGVADFATSRDESGGLLDRLLAKAPSHYRCSIDGRVLLDPVQSPEGCIFERNTITSFLQHPVRLRSGAAVCPISNQPLAAQDLATATALREDMHLWWRTET